VRRHAHLRLILVAALALAVAQIPAGNSTGSASVAGRVSTCPATARDPGPYALEQLTKSIRKSVPRYWHIENQRGRVKLVPRNYRVLAVFSLFPSYPKVPAADRFRRIASKLCGALTADRSWVVMLDFPSAPTAHTGRGVGFFARASGGWRMWHKYR
jgi:hypothetical protein